MAEMTLSAALKKHCFLDGEKLSECLAQIKQLTPDDKEWFKREFAVMGITITASPSMPK